MSTDCGDSASGFVKAIRESGLSIYDLVDGSNPDLLIPTEDLERLLDGGLVGRSLAGIPLRTRSKLVKTWVCETLGYPTPSSFRRTQPRFLGQSFDVYVQKSRNLQLWNEEISAARRYVLISVGDDGFNSSSSSGYRRCSRCFGYDWHLDGKVPGPLGFRGPGCRTRHTG